MTLLMGACNDPLETLVPQRSVNGLSGALLQSQQRKYGEHAQVNDSTSEPHSALGKGMGSNVTNPCYLLLLMVYGNLKQQ